MMFQDEYYPQDGGGSRILSKIRTLIGAFVLMLVITFAIVGFLSGFLFIAESFDDMRADGVAAWNSDITDWNNKDRAAFAAMSFTLDGAPMHASHEEDIYKKMMQYDAHPEELMHPVPFLYSTDIDIAGLSSVVGNELKLKLSTGGAKHSVNVPVVFEETRCRYVQRGKMSRQVCETNYYGLQGICMKVDATGKPTTAIQGVIGASSDVGCFMGTEGMYRPRVSNIWGPGIYKKFSQLQLVNLPNSLQVDVRSYTDPALTASIYTRGYYDFGESPSTKFGQGVFLLLSSSAVIFILCCGCMLNYIWPTAPSYAERLKYFYRRYLRRRHNAFKNWWAVNVGGAPAQEMPDVNQEGLLEEEEEWGPGHKLGAEPAGQPPPLVQSV